MGIWVSGFKPATGTWSETLAHKPNDDVLAADQKRRKRPRSAPRPNTDSVNRNKEPKVHRGRDEPGAAAKGA